MKNYRILTRDGLIKYVGTGCSWFDLDTAKALVNRDKGEMIYEYSPTGERLWEIF